MSGGLHHKVRRKAIFQAFQIRPLIMLHHLYMTVIFYAEVTLKITVTTATCVSGIQTTQVIKRKKYTVL